MDINHLKIFLDLSKTLHFGKTSRNCFLTPASLTRLIQKIEHEIGAPLFHRDNRTVKITTVGTLFKQYCENQITNWEQLQNNIGNSSDKINGLVRIYCSVTASHSILSEILEPIKSNHPNIIISLQTGPAEQTFQKLLNNETDIGLTSFSQKIPQDIKTKNIKTIPLALITPKGRTINDIQTQKLPFIYPKSGLAKQYMMNWFKTQNITPKLFTETSGFEGIMSLVSLGYGASIVPELVYKTNPLKSKIDQIKLTPPLEKLKLGICCKKKKIYLPAINVFLQ